MTHPAGVDPEEWLYAYGPDLTVDELSLLHLSDADNAYIDAGLMKQVTGRWRKVAMVIGMTMMQLKDEDPRWNGIPDLYYAMRLRALVADGKLDSQGDLYRMRFSEVRLPVSGVSR